MAWLFILASYWKAYQSQSILPIHVDSMVTGLPAYKPPVGEPVRCYYRSFFFVFTSEMDSQAKQA
jgi:hypothetical protein